MEQTELFKTAKQLAYDIIKLYQYLTENNKRKEHVLAKQLLLSGTRIGDFIHREDYKEAYHSAASAKYWLDLIHHGEYIDDDRYNAMAERLTTLTGKLYLLSHPDK